MDYYWLCTLACLALTYIIYRAYEKAHHFSALGIPQPPEWPVIGLFALFFFPRRRHVNEVIRCIYNVNKEAKYVGGHMFMGPIIFVRDLELVKQVLVKKFDHFADRKTFVDERTDPLFGQNLNFLNGEKWREVRNILSPAFTSSKMRAMYVLMKDCAERFSDEFVRQYGEVDAIDMKNIFGRFTNDVIASCAFGIEVDSLKNPDNEFYTIASQSTTFKGVTLLKLVLEVMLPRLTRLLGLRIVSKRVTDFFVNVIDATMKTRQANGTYRPDMLQLMMEAKSAMGEEAAAKLGLLEITAQAFLFFLAGFEATSFQISMMAHEMAMNPQIQRRAQLEVDAVMKRCDGKPTYEAVSNSVPYLDAIFSEVLRKHPIAFLNRICSKELELPPALPGGEPYVLKPGAGVMIPVAGMHYDTEIYQNPEQFDPDRFVDKKIAITEVTNLGFGMGPRMCIGNRFAILETKTLMVYLLSRCSFARCDKTCVPLVYDANNFIPVPKDGFWLKIESRS